MFKERLCSYFMHRSAGIWIARLLGAQSFSCVVRLRCAHTGRHSINKDLKLNKSLVSRKTS